MNRSYLFVSNPSPLRGAPLSGSKFLPCQGEMAESQRGLLNQLKFEKISSYNEIL
ncbi:hypothetical protein II582_05345 [bacterium]|nr:hypothetical protein [bacterium]